MDTMKKLLLALILSSFCFSGFSQKKIEEANETVENTNNAVKESIETSKSALKTIGDLFGKNKKDKKNKLKGDVNIIIQQISYDNENLNTVFKTISDIKGVKNPIKSFSDGVATLSFDTKESADALWQQVPKELRGAFKLVEVDEQILSLVSISVE